MGEIGTCVRGREGFILIIKNSCTRIERWWVRKGWPFWRSGTGASGRVLNKSKPENLPHKTFTHLSAHQSAPHASKTIEDLRSTYPPIAPLLSITHSLMQAWIMMDELINKAYTAEKEVSPLVVCVQAGTGREAGLQWLGSARLALNKLIYHVKSPCTTNKCESCIIDEVQLEGESLTSTLPFLDS